MKQAELQNIQFTSRNLGIKRMLKNYLTQTDLLKYEFDLAGWGIDNNTPTALSTGTQIVYDDLRDRGTDPLGVMSPLYLTSGYETFTISGNGQSVAASRINQVKRFVIEKSSCITSGTNKVYLQGSNDLNNWYDITSISLTAGSGDLSIEFTNLYANYRYRIEVGGTLNSSLQISLVETSFDVLLVYKVLSIICGSLIKSVGSAFDVRHKFYESQYQNKLQSIKYSYDIDLDGTADIEVRRKDSRLCL